jgi:UDP-GlcNAc:undecaprenyl-phosphate GlcNAc-1-phosphate transferase
VPAVPLIVTTLLAFAVSLIGTPLAIRLGLRLGIADAPGGRRKHAQLTSRLGAIPLFVSFTVAAIASQFFGVATSDVANESKRFIGLILGGGIVFALALYDDKRDLGSVTQFLAQALASLVAVASLIFIERFKNPINGQEMILPERLGVEIGWVVVVALSLFWFIGMMNTVNFLDGVDGLAATVSLIAALFTLVHMLRERQYSVALLPAALVGALLGFLIFNFQPARIFLGGGALYLGFVLACVGIIAGAKVALLLLVMGLPIADVLWQMFDRWRNGRSLTSADRGHLHLRLFDNGWSARKIVALYAAACVAFGGIALITQPPLFKLITIAVLFIIVIVSLIRLSSRDDRHTKQKTGSKETVA